MIQRPGILTSIVDQREADLEPLRKSRDGQIKAAKLAFAEASAPIWDTYHHRRADILSQATEKSLNCATCGGEMLEPTAENQEIVSLRFLKATGRELGFKFNRSKYCCFNCTVVGRSRGRSGHAAKCRLKEMAIDHA